jgi:hypothetical protein
MGIAMVARWASGDHSFAGCRLQRDGAADEPFVARMPPTPQPRCPVEHVASDEPIEEIGSIATTTVAELAERALACAGDDAEMVLGRRVVPLAGVYCSRCGTTWPAAPLLLPAALTARPCRCAQVPRPLAERSTIGIRELLVPGVADRTLRAWGAGHGDEFRVRGAKGSMRLRCRFVWEDLA